MAPVSQRRTIPKDRFSSLFAALKTQAYLEPPSRGPSKADVRAVAWNPTGIYIAAGLANNSIRVWNPDRPSYKHSTELRGHSAAVEKVVFNPTKDAELGSISRDGTFRLWDVRSKTCIAKLDIGPELISLAWSNDGSTVIIGTKNDILVPISMVSGSPVALPSRPQNDQTNLTAFSNSVEPVDLLVTQGNGSVKILDYPSFAVMHILHAHTSACASVAFSPNGRYFAVGGHDALISLWDTTDWICQRTIPTSASGKIVGISWSFDGRYICVAMDEVSNSSGAGSIGGLEIYHAPTGEVVHTVATASADTPAVAWHPNRYWLAYSHVDRTEAGVIKGNTALRIIGAAGGPSM